jgi:hypothetical protein
MDTGVNGASVYPLMRFPSDRDDNAPYELERGQQVSATLRRKNIPTNRPFSGGQHNNENCFEWQRSAAKFGGWTNLTKFER